jgi:hypothetical protein
MSYTNYGSGEIAFSTFDTWANNVTSDVNSGIDNALSDWYPAQSAQYSVSFIRSKNIFYGSMACGTGGTISLTAPYTVTATTSTVQIKNMDLGVNNPTLVASATYPYTFHSWRTAASGGGSSVTASATLTITTGTTQATTYYAYFTTTHITP